MNLPPKLPELEELATLLTDLRKYARVNVAAQVTCAEGTYPIHTVSLGAEEPAAPALAFVGGVHGLERIGTQVVLAYLRTLAVRLTWDRVLHETLSRVRLVFMPLVNPCGMLLGLRGNPRGVDLMRNAPRTSEGRGTLLVGGQRWSRHLPWYAGEPEQDLEVESQALVRFIESELSRASAAIAIDCHSGFGAVDRLWFPYARTRRPFPHLAEVVGLKRVIDATLPNHVYRIEPQAQAYTIQGDLWDYLYDRSRARDPRRPFVPLTLEMGSWAWVRKNPRQLWSRFGTFNPVLPHRLRRTLRRHLPLFDLLVHAIASPAAWVVANADERARLEHIAFSTWPRV